MPMRFEKRVEEAGFLNSRLERESQAVEYRSDPLTGFVCRINLQRTKRLKAANPPYPGDYAAKPPDCPFCPENIEKATPRFLPELVPAGRLKRGECVLFPNLFPLAGRHAIGVMTEQHFLDLDEFQPERIADSLACAREYMEIGSRQAGGPAYPMFIWNHLPASAASMIHPHFQVIVDEIPTPYQTRLLDCSAAYFQTQGRSYWTDLVREERDLGARYVGRVGGVAVVASFAPQGNREVQVVVDEACSLLDLEERLSSDLAEVMVRLLRGYKSMGINSFNVSSFSAQAHKRIDHYRLHVKLIARPVYEPYYRNDTGILERFHGQADIDKAPEETAALLREQFV